MQFSCTILYCYLWPVQLYSIFPHYLINGTISRENVLNIKYVFWFSLQHVWNISHSMKKWVRYEKCTTCLRVKYPLFLSDFNETWIFWTDFPKILKCKISWKSILCGSRVVACRWTDTTKLIVPFAILQMHLRTRWTQHKERTQKLLHTVLQLRKKTLVPISGSLAGGVAAAVFAAYRRRAWAECLVKLSVPHPYRDAASPLGPSLQRPPSVWSPLVTLQGRGGQPLDGCCRPLPWLAFHCYPDLRWDWQAVIG